MSSETWTVRKVLGWTTQHFEKADVDAPRLTAELLLAHTLKLDRVRLYTELDRPLHKDELAAYRALIQQRSAGEPTQYLTGQKEFYGRRFAVDSRVLIPRPETELLVEAVVKRLKPARVLDLCTGSGCIAVTIACELPEASVWAVDLSGGTCAVARFNADALGAGARVTVLEGDLFGAVPTGAKFDVIVSNPPYVKTGELKTLQREVQREPKLALDGGADGLDVVRRIAAEAQGWLKAGGSLALEIGDGQGDSVRDILMRAGYHDVVIERDLARLDRLAFGKKAAT
ncbi:MAG: peptide chain release factor N(5)-glutamine methyltransferase [Myxococcaceae bacterium]|nr:peptide chain release factor N(5)-glutamine methyltransferase [Myxococcaceae bacterium]